MSDTPEARLAAEGFDLPDPPKPAGLYVPVVRVGELLHLSGHISTTKGRLGDGLDVADGQRAARQATLALLATVRRELGSLDKVARVVKAVGFVASTPDFDDQPQVMNGCSSMLITAFGEAGRSARSAVGVAALPLGVAVEIEAIFEAMS
ncbi:MAG: RidA family protein [Planctomycetota bacterium]